MIRAEVVDKEDDGIDNDDDSLDKHLSVSFYFDEWFYETPSSNGTIFHRLSKKYDYFLKGRSPQASSSSPPHPKYKVMCLLA